MKSLILIIIGITTVLLSSCACHGIADPTIRKANASFLPVVNQPMPGFSPRVLPVDNFYRHVPGCYIACYSREKQNSVYSVGQGIYVKGLVRINGLYIGRTCQAQGYFFKDISAMTYFKDLCQKRLANCKNSNCWAGGDTGGWFGIP